jgi:spore germination protein
MKKIFILLAILISTPVLAASTENIFYYYPGDRGYDSVKDNYKDIDILAPQIYTVGYDMKLKDVEDKKILKLAKKKRIDVMPLVVQSNFDITLMSHILNNEDAQDEIIEDLIDQADDHDYIGWQFDFENIFHAERDMYVDFMKKANKEFKKEGLLFSVAVIPRTTAYDKNSGNQDWSSGYNVGEIAKNSDFISIMSYDDPLSSGPVSSIQYLKKAVDNTLLTVSPDKISMGIPLYCWQYELGKIKKVASVVYEVSKNTQEKYKENGVGSFYTDFYEAEFFAFIKKDTGVNYIWCDNERSVKVKLDYTKSKGLRGSSFWAIGQEDEKMWKNF